MARRYRKLTSEQIAKVEAGNIRAARVRFGELSPEEERMAAKAGPGTVGFFREAAKYESPEQDARYGTEKLSPHSP